MSEHFFLPQEKSSKDGEPVYFVRVKPVIFEAWKTKVVVHERSKIARNPYSATTGDI
jgi:hypothetical protein